MPNTGWVRGQSRTQARRHAMVDHCRAGVLLAVPGGVSGAGQGAHRRPGRRALPAGGVAAQEPGDRRRRPPPFHADRRRHRGRPRPVRLFRIIDRSAYIENPQRTGIRLGSFDFRDWATIGAEGLVKGGFRNLGNRVQFEFWLYDVFRQESVIGKRYSGDIKDARRMAHKFVDEIILKLTGTRGVFDTRIAYVSTGGDRFKEIYLSHLDGTEKKKVGR